MENMKIVEQPQQAKLAMLIDADNAQPTKIEEILVEVAKYGKVIIKNKSLQTTYVSIITLTPKNNG